MRRYDGGLRLEIAELGNLARIGALLSFPLAAAGEYVPPVSVYTFCLGDWRTAASQGQEALASYIGAHAADWLVSDLNTSVNDVLDNVCTMAKKAAEHNPHCILPVCAPYPPMGDLPMLSIPEASGRVSEQLLWSLGNANGTADCTAVVAAENSTLTDCGGMGWWITLFTLLGILGMVTLFMLGLEVRKCCVGETNNQGPALLDDGHAEDDGNLVGSSETPI